MREGIARPGRARAWTTALTLVLLVVLPTPILAAVQSSSVSSSGGGTPAPACFGGDRVNNDSLIPGIVSSLRIAALMPVLTSTPYSQYKSGSFYAFYSKYQNVSVGKNVTTDLSMLETPVSSGYSFDGGWGLSYGLYQFLTSPTAKDCGLTVGGNVRVFDDINVSEGAIFDKNGSANFDVVVAGFSEYTTEQEYQALERFVSGGGVLVLVGSHNFDWRVAYNSTTRTETLVQGHGWSFDGKAARAIPCAVGGYQACTWANESAKWLASMICCDRTLQYHGATVNPEGAMGMALEREFGGTVFTPYASHEENSVTNMTGTSIVATFANQSGTLVASYVHEFRKGTVVCMCVFGDDIIARDPSTQYFALLGMLSRFLSPTGICPQPVAGRAEGCGVVSTETSTTSATPLATAITGSSRPPETGPGWNWLVFGAGPVIIVVLVAVLGALAFKSSRRERQKP